ncbi:hypothetical protein GCK72_023396 [Caenorhabditis remanei]|uniref:Uncharacterized protein n=1 Tax=Caenorhabditis remanei TaxID=31234 RepID=A0A6A5FWC7_CAERE|nr:hypothetical protein GCK72_023396 [Caenorhabditis remanei]KAF1746938.1 hypothetical protein GCK72_023396 [Caenorhabditis remanei]
MISTLQQMSGNAVQKRILKNDFPRRDNTPNYPLKLPSDFGNLITKFMFRCNKNRPNFNELADYLKITDAYIDAVRSFDIEHCEFFFKQELTCLKITFVPWEKLAEECKQLKMNRFDLIFVLRKLVNSGARHTMQTFCLSDTKINLAGDWAKYLGNFFPLLTTLDLAFIKINQYEFQQMCAVFKNLKRLSLRRNGITSVNGVSKLKQLEVLDVSECAFSQKEDLSDIFDLEQLNVLKFTGAYYDLRNIELYVDNNRSAPRLAYIDFSSNAITRNTIEKIVKTHPRLQTFLLIGCVIDDIGNIEEVYKHIKFYLTTSLSHCFESIDFCCFKKEIDFSDMDDKLKDILEDIDNMLHFKYYEQSTENIVKSVEYICKANSVVKTLTANRFLTNCFYTLCLKPTRCQLFNHHQKQMIVHDLVVAHERAMRCIEPDGKDILYRVWSVLILEDVVESNCKYLGHVCRCAREIIANAELDLKCRICAITVLAIFIDKLKPTFFKIVTSGISLEEHLYRLLEVSSLTHLEYTYVSLLIRKLHQLNTSTCNKEKRNIVKKYMIWMDVFEEYRDLTMDSLIAILPSLGKRPRVYFREKEYNLL